MGQGIQEWTKLNLRKVAFKNILLGLFMNTFTQIYWIKTKNRQKNTSFLVSLKGN